VAEGLTSSKNQLNLGMLCRRLSGTRIFGNLKTKAILDQESRARDVLDIHLGMPDGLVNQAIILRLVVVYK